MLPLITVLGVPAPGAFFYFLVLCSIFVKLLLSLKLSWAFIMPSMNPSCRFFSTNDSRLFIPLTLSIHLEISSFIRWDLNMQRSYPRKFTPSTGVPSFLKKFSRAYGEFSSYTNAVLTSSMRRHISFPMSMQSRSQVIWFNSRVRSGRISFFLKYNKVSTAFDDRPVFLQISCTSRFIDSISELPDK